MKPVLLVIAGPNGAGKTTVTVRLREDQWSDGVEYLNPDEIARDRFGDWNSPEAVLNAARWAERSSAASRDPWPTSPWRSGWPTAPAYVYDNSVENVEARLCFRTQDALLRKVYGPLPEWVADAAQGLATHPQFVDMRVA